MAALQTMTQTQEIDRTIYQERLVAGVSTLFAFLALTLASIGLDLSPMAWRSGRMKSACR